MIHACLLLFPNIDYLLNITTSIIFALTSLFSPSIIVRVDSMQLQVNWFVVQLVHGSTFFLNFFLIYVWSVRYDVKLMNVLTFDLQLRLTHRSCFFLVPIQFFSTFYVSFEFYIILSVLCL